MVTEPLSTRAFDLVAVTWSGFRQLLASDLVSSSRRLQTMRLPARRLLLAVRVCHERCPVWGQPRSLSCSGVCARKTAELAP